MAQDAPFAKASARKSWPSKFGPAMAKKQSPGWTVRESVPTDVTFCPASCVLRPVLGAAMTRAFRILARVVIESSFIFHLFTAEHAETAEIYAL